MASKETNVSTYGGTTSLQHVLGKKGEKLRLGPMAFPDPFEESFVEHVNQYSYQIALMHRLVECIIFFLGLFSFWKAYIIPSGGWEKSSLLTRVGFCSYMFHIVVDMLFFAWAKFWKRHLLERIEGVKVSTSFLPNAKPLVQFYLPLTSHCF